jgi:hypothetical protein
MARRKDQAQFNMRLDKPLLKQLQNAAKDQDRSVNSEMVHRLEQSFTRDSIQDRLTENTDRLSALLNLALEWLTLAAKAPDKEDVYQDVYRQTAARILETARLRLMGQEQAKGAPGARARTILGQEPELPMARPGPHKSERGRQ